MKTRHSRNTPESE